VCKDRTEKGAEPPRLTGFDAVLKQKDFTVGLKAKFRGLRTSEG